MKTLKYRHGNINCKSYFQTAGNGFEVGFIFGRETIFIGNFIHKAEATRWYSKMNKEIRSFAKRFKIAPYAPMNWYKKFLSHTLYGCYYTFINQVIPKHNRVLKTTVVREIRQHAKMNRKWHPSEKMPFLKAA